MTPRAAASNGARSRPSQSSAALCGVSLATSSRPSSPACRSRAKAMPCSTPARRKRAPSQDAERRNSSRASRPSRTSRSRNARSLARFGSPAPGGSAGDGGTGV
ncbi:hypothetical protein P4203_15410 [Pseudomonas aeruginosa]|nr:hypothetical protein [Pseudomonas aeruginosa]